MNLNPMYQKTKTKSALNAPPQSKTPTRPRKQRSDKKHDVKVPLTEAQKSSVRWKAYKNNMKATPFATKLVEDAIHTKSYLKELKAYPYEDTYDYVHVKLQKEDYEELVKLSILWGVSIRKGAHRILLHLLEDGVDLDGEN